MIDLLHYLSDDTILEQLKKLVPEQYHARLEAWCDRLDEDFVDEKIAKSVTKAKNHLKDELESVREDLEESYKRVEELEDEINEVAEHLEELKAKYEPS